MSKWKTRVASMLLLTVLLVSVFSTPASTAATWLNTRGVYEGTAPKYVFMFIGDGMSFPQVAAAEMYLGKQSKLTDLVDGGGLEKLSFSNFPAAGAAATYDTTSFIPDSASTATSVASGYKTLSGVINMDPGKKVTYTPISESLKALGYRVGIITSVPLNHATPAAFYAKVASRNSYYDIAVQGAKSGFDFFGGGSFLQPTGSDGKQKDIIDVFKDNGYTIANDNSAIRNLNADSGKVVAIAPDLSVDGTAMTYEIDRKQGELSLADFTRKGIDVLTNSKGFFLMVEGGKIDWADHANDGPSAIHDTIAFSKAVSVAIDFYNAHPKETLIIVTGDHECGGMSIGFAGTGYSTFFEKMQGVTMSYEVFDKTVIAAYRESHAQNAKLSDLYLDIKRAFGLLAPGDVDASYKPGMVLSDSEIKSLESALAKSMIAPKERKFTEEEQLLYGGYEPLSIALTHILNNKAGITFSSYSHTGLPVPVFALGVGADLYNSYYDNTDIYAKTADIFGLR